jgi:hypothetical protein
LLPDKAGDEIFRALCVVIGLEVKIRLAGITIAGLLKGLTIVSTILHPHFTGALRSQYCPRHLSRDSYATRWHRIYSKTNVNQPDLGHRPPSPDFRRSSRPRNCQYPLFAKAETITSLSDIV